MMRQSEWFLLSIVICYMISVVHPPMIDADGMNPVVGWHWYNEPQVKKRKQSQLYGAFQNLSAQEQLKRLQMATQELRDRAILTGQVKDIANYKRAQDFWVHKATRFTIGWEKMLLDYPALDYSLQYGHENALAPIMQQRQHQLELRAINHLKQQNGFLFFYRASNPSDVLFAKVLVDFTKSHHFALLPISEDNTLDSVFGHKARRDVTQQKAHALGVFFFPALLLVNPMNGMHQVVSYGYQSQAELSSRLLNIDDHWEPNF